MYIILSSGQPSLVLDWHVSVLSTRSFDVARAREERERERGSVERYVFECFECCHLSSEERK